jgi:hypothetical protein
VSKVEVDIGKPLIAWTQADSDLIAAELKREIIDRTRNEHIGADGQPFRPYINKKRNGKPAGPVDLTRSGKMLDNISARGTPQKAILRTTVTYASRQDRSRPWFGFTEAELDALLERIILPIIDKRLDESSGKDAEVIHG